jgi:hypothetical protein
MMSHQELTAPMPCGYSLTPSLVRYRMQAEGRAVLAPPMHISADGACVFHHARRDNRRTH